jgi:raffinose/stachyose/melibiose transport system substrate-binding protein
MKNAARAAIAVAIACTVAVGVAACGGGGDGGSSEDSGSSELKGTVTVWDPVYKTFPEYTSAINKLDAKFEKENPKVEVERIGYPEEGYIATVRTAFISGEVPDALGLYPGYNGILTFTDSLEVVNGQISPELEEQLTQWSSVTPGLKEEGDHYGIPQGLNGAVFYYNKKLFAKAGLPTDFHPESWEELREAGEKLKAAGIQPFADGGKPGPGGNFIDGGWGFGLGLQTENSDQERAELAEGKLPYTEASIAKAFDPVIELYEADLFSNDFFSTDFIEGFTRFEEEKGAIVLGLWSVAGSYLQFNEKLGEENVGIFPAPGASGYSVFSSAPFAIPVAADNKDAALALLEFESSKESVEFMLKVGKSLPVRKDVPLPADSPVQGRELVGAAQNGETEPFPLIALTAEPEIIVTAEFGQILQGRTSVADVQKQMQEAAEKEGSAG